MGLIDDLPSAGEVVAAIVREAELVTERLNADLSEVLGVEAKGVFVTNVIEGSPARDAGLRGGDIILKADSIKVETPIDLVRAIRIADDNDRTVALQIVRKHKQQSLTLRW